MKPAATPTFTSVVRPDLRKHCGMIPADADVRVVRDAKYNPVSIVVTDGTIAGIAHMSEGWQAVAYDAEARPIYQAAREAANRYGDAKLAHADRIEQRQRGNRRPVA